MYLEKIGTYWDSRAEGYSLSVREQLGNENGALYRAKLREHAPEGGPLACLDAGCGPGFFSILLAQDGHSVTAVDYSQGMLERARENFGRMGVGVRLMRGDAQNLPFADGSFDYIVSRNLLWNLEQPERALAEWIRLLRPGGRLLIADGNHYLHYSDGAYKCAWEAGGREPSRHGVDMTPINEIARDLPLSGEYRPQWDTGKLMELGMDGIRADLFRQELHPSGSGRPESVIKDFIVSAEKPLPAPPPDAEDERRQINARWTAAADNYSGIVNDELASFRAAAWTGRILDNAPDKAPLDVLDAGCGPGFFSILLAGAGHRVVALDDAAGMLAHAAENAARHGVSPLFLKGDCHDLPFADGSFDLVVSRNVTHTLRDHLRAYREWYRVLRPGGRLLVFDANWHLMQTDPAVRREFARRERECIRVYGSNFTGGEPEDGDYTVVRPHRLGLNQRPDWDLPLLRRAGFTGIRTERDITGGLWDGKEKLLYGATPMFMIAADK